MFRKIQAAIAKAKTSQPSQEDAAFAADDSTSVERRIKKIMAKVFKIDINEINEETSADKIDQWTSLEHVELLVQLQKEFDVELTDLQIVEMLSYNAVVENIKTALSN